MIRIAYLIDTIESPTAGTEKQLLLLLRRLDRSKFAPILCVLRSSPWLESEFTLCPLHCVGVRTFKRPSALGRIWRFSRFLSRHGIDIVQTHFKDDNKVGCLAGRLAGTRAIVSSRRNQGYWHTTSELRLLRVLNRWVTVFVANSRDTMRAMARKEGVDESRYRVIYNGLELRDFPRRDPAVARSVRTELAIPAEARIAVQVANLRPVKRVEVLIRAIGRIKEEGGNVVAAIVGGGGELRRLETLARELGLEDRVRFLGTRTDIPRILAGADVGVLTSESESFSNAVVEYLAAGLPVVCTEVGGVREAVADGVAGLLVPPNDPAALAAALQRVFAENLQGEPNRNRAESLFSAEAMVARFESVYEGVLR